MGTVKIGAFILIILSILGWVMLRNNMLGGFDFDSNGKISTKELWNSIDVGKRETIQGSHYCIEYFQKKDGLTIKEVCEKRP